MKNLFTKFTFLIILGALVWSGYNYFSFKPKTQTVESVKTVEKAEVEKTLIKSSKYDDIDVKTIERRENDGRSLLNVAYPVTESREVNQIIEFFSQEFIDLFIETALSQEQLYQTYFARTGTKSHTTVADFTQHFDVSFANEEYVSFVFYQYQSTGGTGMNITFSKIFNRQTGTEIPIKDLFIDSSYLARLSKISREILIARMLETAKTLDGTEQALAEYVESNKISINKGTESLAENFTSLVISDENILTIHFDKYQVGPGSSGIVSVEIPLEQVADILAPEIKAIFSIAKADTEKSTSTDAVSQTKPKKGSAEKVDCDIAKCVALTFDDGPSVYTGTLLDTLKKYKVPATFFVLGRSAKIQPNTITRIVNEGHELGNHTWDHKNLRTLSGAEIDTQLRKTDELLDSIVGVKPLYLRPPYGAYSNEVLAHVDRPIILWSVDPEDWKQQSQEELVEKMTSPQSGAIILAHDIHESTVDAIPAVITELEKQEFVFVTISELLKKPLEAGKAYSQR